MGISSNDPTSRLGPEPDEPYRCPMSPLYRRHEHRELSSPVLMLATDSWVDAGLGARAAIAHILDDIPTDQVATFDSDQLIDFRSRRPTARITDGVVTHLEWPEIELRCGRDPDGKDLLALVGPEPDIAWHAFIAAVVELTVELGCRLVVSVGAYPAPVPHTRPVPLTAIATEDELAAKVGIVGGSIEVPAGIQTALQVGYAAAGIPAIGIWARVPHYLAAAPYPPVSAALVTAMEAVSGMQLASASLREAADGAAAEIDKIIAESEEHQAMVHELERTFDAREADLENLPSGDELAAELEQYLRGQSDSG
jgi:PAC2 family